MRRGCLLLRPLFEQGAQLRRHRRRMGGDWLIEPAAIQQTAVTCAAETRPTVEYLAITGGVRGRGVSQLERMHPEAIADQDACDGEHAGEYFFIDERLHARVMQLRDHDQVRESTVGIQSVLV